MAPRRAGDRRPIRAYRIPEIPVRPQHRRTLVLVAALAAVLAVPTWRVLARAAAFGAPTIPPELIGVWATTAPGYADRALEFTRASVIVHTDDNHFTVHPLRAVRRSTHGLFVAYHIEYHDVDGPTVLDLRFVPSPQPLIRLEHLPYVWRRTPRR